jgi:hypothetical protein
MPESITDKASLFAAIEYLWGIEVLWKSVTQVISLFVNNEMTEESKRLFQLKAGCLHLLNDNQLTWKPYVPVILIVEMLRGKFGKKFLLEPYVAAHYLMDNDVENRNISFPMFGLNYPNISKLEKERIQGKYSALIIVVRMLPKTILGEMEKNDYLRETLEAILNPPRIFGANQENNVNRNQEISVSVYQKLIDRLYQKRGLGFVFEKFMMNVFLTTDATAFNMNADMTSAWNISPPDGDSVSSY